MTETVDELIDDPHVVSAAEATDPDVRPTIIAIMNETYSDISTYPQLAESYGGPIPFSTYEGTIATGDVYVSAMGGGTCNSEFEFLTGSSMGLLGPGVYPYMLYNLEGVDSMVSYLKSIGYATSAIHPADAQNWRRDRVYEQLGFDEFFDITSFDGADYFRNMVSDGATYDKILQIMDEGEGPQFIFDVTIANHGGYDTGTIAEEDMMHIDMNGEESAEVNEYVTAIARADADLAAFLAKLAQREEPIVVVLFGDHQPGVRRTTRAYGRFRRRAHRRRCAAALRDPLHAVDERRAAFAPCAARRRHEPELSGSHHPESGRFAAQRVLRIPLCHEAIAAGD